MPSPTSISSLLSPISTSKNPFSPVVLPSPSTSLFEKSFGALLSNFKGTVSEDDANMMGAHDVNNYFPAPLSPIKEEADAHLHTFTSPALTATSATTASPEMGLPSSNLQLNTSTMEGQKMDALPTPSAGFKDPAFHSIVGSFLDSLESLSAPAFDFEGLDKMMMQPHSMGKVKYHDHLMLNQPADTHEGLSEFQSSMLDMNRTDSSSPSLPMMNMSLYDDGSKNMAYPLPTPLSSTAAFPQSMLPDAMNSINSPNTSPLMDMRYSPQTSPLHRALVSARGAAPSPSYSPRMSPVSFPPLLTSASPALSEKSTASNGSMRSTPFKCSKSNCNKSFDSYEKLSSHMQAPHSNTSSSPKDKPYRCEICPQTFSRSHDLKRHYYIHTQEKPYVCHRCKKGFSRRDALRRHERSVIEGRKVHCVPKDTMSNSYVSGMNTASFMTPAPGMPMNFSNFGM